MRRGLTGNKTYLATLQAEISSYRVSRLNPRQLAFFQFTTIKLVDILRVWMKRLCGTETKTYESMISNCFKTRFKIRVVYIFKFKRENDGTVNESVLWMKNIGSGYQI
uniref:Uncharacterized protein n=1 Tax=Romanomermis culicivorax TaxID=13658 RepID=A0A915K9A5_ROMCU